MNRHLERLPCVVYRGGTSKAVMLRREVPASADDVDGILLAIMGSPDARQIDGLGGGDAPRSKVAIVGPPTRQDADVDYTFVQVGVTEPTLDWAGNCGNISAAVGPFAIEEGLVIAHEPATTVRIHNTNTGAILVARVPVSEGSPTVTGSTAIAGVPGTGAPVELDYAGTVGAVTGSLFPTGRPVDSFATDRFGRVDTSIIDVANVVAYVDARGLGATGTEGPDGYTADQVEGIEEIRGRVAARLGMCRSWDMAITEAPMFPLITLVAPPADY